MDNNQKYYDVEIDILNIIRRTPIEKQREVTKNILFKNMEFLGKYDYLNDMPKQVLYSHAEKIIRNVIDNDEYFYDRTADEIIDVFLNKLPGFNPNKLTKKSFVNLKENTKIKMAEVAYDFNNSRKKLALIGTTVVLSLATVITLSATLGRSPKETVTESQYVTESSMYDDLLAESSLEIEPTTEEEETVVEEIPESKIETSMEETTPETTQVEVTTAISPSEMSNEEKIAIILEKWHIDRNQLQIIIATVHAEAWGDSYVDAYATMSTLFNSMRDADFINGVKQKFGEENVDNIFYYLAYPDHYEAYYANHYIKFMNVQNGPVFDAVIDALYTGVTANDFIAFRNRYAVRQDAIQYAPNGNNYFMQTNRANEFNPNIIEAVNLLYPSIDRETLKQAIYTIYQENTMTR